MRWLTVLFAVVALSGCAEVFNGPRVVRYSDNYFYVRDVPVLQDDRVLDQDIVALCEKNGGLQPSVVSVEQYFTLDVRYTTILCLDPAEQPALSSTPGLIAASSPSM